MPLSVGDKLGPYEILAPIGKGGMGEVYRARDPRLNRDVAIKVSTAQFTERFAREAQAIAALNHPNICQIYDVGTNYLVMEFVEGPPLKGPLSLEKSLEYAGQILDALDAAHKKGITHRDLKPANILVTRQGIKLLDFGLAKQAGPIRESDSTVTQGLTGQGQILGTLQYMSPEQLQGKDVDARSDLFSFGCVLYEMLTGKQAFEGASAASVIAAILEREPAPLNLSPPLERVIRTCLAKAPDERIQTASDVKKALLWAIEPQPDEIVIRPASRVRERIAWSTALLAVVSAFFAAGVRNSRVATAPAETVRLSVVTPETSSPLDFAISPDGHTLAFVAYAEGEKQLLWVRPLNSTTAQPLAGTEEATQPFWSPDNRFIGFFAGGKLKKIEVAGGTPQTICEVATPRGGTWNRNGVILLTRGANSGISRVSAAGGEPTPVTALDFKRESSHRYPQFLPDGRHFLFFVQAGKGNGISVGSIDSKESKHVLDTNMAALYAQPGYLLFVREGVVMEQAFDPGKIELRGEPIRIVEGLMPDPFNRVAFSVSDNGVLAYRSSPVKGSRQLAWFDRSGKQLGSVGPGGEYFNPELSPNGKEVIFSQTDLQSNNVDIWRMDLPKGERRRLTFDPAIDIFSIWSPDGNRILFASSRDGPYQVYQRLSSGGGTEERMFQQAGTTVVPRDWSADGRFVILVMPDPQSAQQLWVLPLFGDRKPVPFVENAATNEYPRFSPDGKWIAYASNESGKFEVYVQTFPSGNGKWQVSTNGGVQPRWRRDGKELFYLASDRKLMAVPVRSASSFEFGAPVPLFATKTVGGAAAFYAGYIHQYDVTPDGQRFLLNTEADASATPVTVVLNWTAGLKK